MIIKASERSGAKLLALHLSNLEDNNHVELHKVHGCMAQDIEGALTEMYAISRATRCKKHMFSISLSPPKGETPTIADYEAAVDTITKRLGLDRHLLDVFQSLRIFQAIKLTCIRLRRLASTSYGHLSLTKTPFYRNIILIKTFVHLVTHVVISPLKFIKIIPK